MTQFHTFRQVLAIPGLRRLWMGQLVSIAGDFLAMFAVLSVASFRMHATPLQMSGVTLSYMLPLAIFGPVAGVLVDRWNVRHTMIASDILRGSLALLLMFSPGLPAIYAILFAISTISTFFIPAQSVLIRNLVHRDMLLSANAILQQGMLIIRLASPAVAGTLVAKFGPSSCFCADVLSFFFSALMLHGVNFVCPSRPAESTRRTIIADLTLGIRFILTHSGIAFVMIAMACATFTLSCFSPLIAIFVRDILHADVRMFGAMSSMMGLGMIAGTQAAHRVPKPACSMLSPSPRQVVVLGLGAIACGIAVIAGALCPSAAVFGGFVMGTGVGLLMVPAQTLIQSETPLGMVGRVSSGVMSLISIAQVSGLALSGVSAAAIGLRPLFYASAMVLAALAAAGFWTLGREAAGKRSAGTQHVIAT